MNQLFNGIRFTWQLGIIKMLILWIAFLPH